MSVQMKYGYSTPRGIPGGLYDLSPYVIDTRLNEAANGKMLFGMGVVQGTTPGSNVGLPATGATAATFEGVTVNGFTQQHDLEGKVSLNNNQSVGVLRSGRIYARLVSDAAPAYGEAVYLVLTGDDAGLFTDAVDGNNTLKINARFLGGKGSGSVAPVEVFTQAIDSTIANNVTLSSAVADGVTAASSSTKITLTFAQPILGLQASDITITDGTGSATKGTLTKVSSTVYEIALSSVTTEGNVSVAVASPNGYIVNGSPKTVAVYKQQ